METAVRAGLALQSRSCFRGERCKRSPCILSCNVDSNAARRGRVAQVPLPGATAGSPAGAGQRYDAELAVNSRARSGLRQMAPAQGQPATRRRPGTRDLPATQDPPGPAGASWQAGCCWRPWQLRSWLAVSPRTRSYVATNR